jgi:hypothetical protein
MERDWMGPVDVSVLPTSDLVGIQSIMRDDQTGILCLLGLYAPSGPEWNYNTRDYYINDAPLAPFEFTDLYRNSNNVLPGVLPCFNYSHSMLSDNTCLLNVF